MPELPEVETIARGLAPDCLGRSVESVQIVDESAVSPGPGAFRALVQGREILAVRRRAKLLIFDLAGEHSLAVHLRMTGRVLALGPEDTPIRPRVVLFLSGGGRVAFSDLRRFGRMHAFGPGGLAAWPFFRDLGPEPLSLSAKDFRARLAGSKSRIKALLLDQRVLAGIGNIYADEALFRARIRPDTPACQIAPARLTALHKAVQAVLTQAIAENGSSIRDYRNAHGDAGAFQNHFRAYGRAGKPCLVCKTPLVSLKVAGRTSTFCPDCQD